LYACCQSCYLNRYRRDDRLDVYAHGPQARQSGGTDVIGSRFDTNPVRRHGPRNTTFAAARPQRCVDAGRGAPQLTEQYGQFPDRRIGMRSDRDRTSCCRHRPPHGVTVALDMPPRRRSHGADEAFAQARHGDASEWESNDLPQRAVSAAPPPPEPDDDDPHPGDHQQQRCRGQRHRQLTELSQRHDPRLRPPAEGGKQRFRS
jgi:hypothetical protein